MSVYTRIHYNTARYKWSASELRVYRDKQKLMGRFAAGAPQTRFNTPVSFEDARVFGSEDITRACVRSGRRRRRRRSTSEVVARQMRNGTGREGRVGRRRRFTRSVDAVTAAAGKQWVIKDGRRQRRIGPIRSRGPSLWARRSVSGRRRRRRNSLRRRRRSGKMMYRRSERRPVSGHVENRRFFIRTTTARTTAHPSISKNTTAQWKFQR